MLSIFKASILQQGAALATDWLCPFLCSPGAQSRWMHLLLLWEQSTLIPALMRAEHSWGSWLKSDGNEGSLFAQIPAKTCLTLMYFSFQLREHLFQHCFWNNSRCCAAGSTVPGCSVAVKTEYYVLENRVLAKCAALFCPACLLWMLNCTRTVCSLQNAWGTVKEQKLTFSRAKLANGKQSCGLLSAPHLETTTLPPQPSSKVVMMTLSTYRKSYWFYNS